MQERRYSLLIAAFSFAVLGFFPYMAHPGTRFFYGSVIPLLFVVVCIESNLSIRKTLCLPLILPLFAIVLVSIVYTFHSVYPYQSQEKLVRILLGVTLYVTVASLVTQRRDRLTLLWGIFIGGTLLSIHALWLQFTGYADLLERLQTIAIYESTMQRELIRTLEAGRALGRFGNPNHLAGYLILVLWCEVLLWGDCREHWQRAILAFGALLQIFCIYQTYSRSGLLVLLISGVLFGFWLLGRVNRTLRKIIVWGAVVGLVVVGVAVLLLGGQALGGRLMTTSTIVARVHFFRQALCLVREYFPDGAGLDSFRFLASRYIRPGELESLYPHNLFLGAAQETGFIGLLVYLWFTATGLRWRGRTGDLPAVVGWGAFAAFILLSCIDFHNEVGEILFLFLAIQGICHAQTTMTDQRSADSSQPHPNPSQSWGGNCDNTHIPLNKRGTAHAQTAAHTSLFSPKIGGDTEGVDSLPPSQSWRGRLFVLALIVFLWWLLVLCPFKAERYQQRGLDAVAAGKPGVEQMCRAASWAPRDAEIANNLGRSLRMLPSEEAREEGIDYLRKATRLNPYQAYFYGDLADALFDEGRTQEALEVNEKAHELFPKKTLYIRRKAKYMLALGRRDDWKRLIELAETMEQRDEELRP